MKPLCRGATGGLHNDKRNEHNHSFVAETILKPLKLEHTEFEDIRHLPREGTEIYNLYVPFTLQEIQTMLTLPRLDYSYNLGGGNILTTADELARFGQAFLRPGFFSAAKVNQDLKQAIGKGTVDCTTGHRGQLKPATSLPAPK